jgi:hypothetical protein
MTDTQTAYELRQALKKPGCPVCWMVQRSGAKYLETTFYESVLDPGARKQIVDSLGFCYGHTWLIADLKLSDALGQAIVYKDVVGDLQATLRQQSGSDGRQIAEALDAGAVCPACRIEQGTLERAIETLSKILGEAVIAAEYRLSSGVCLPHMRLLLPKLERAGRDLVVELRIAQLEALGAELAEFIRKNDYRFKDESMGIEGDSYLRTAAMLVGRHAPGKKQDLA